jgi:hypothetical protein
VREDLERNWRECGAAILIYGSANPFWYRNQIMLYRKQRKPGERLTRSRFKILNCPPKEKPSAGVSLPKEEADEVDCRAGLSSEVVDRVVAEIAS